MVPVTSARGSHQPVEQHVVGGESMGPAVVQYGKRLSVVLADEKFDAEMLFFGDGAHRRFVGRAGGYYDSLVAQIAIGTDRGGARHQELGAGDKEDRRKGGLLFALGIGRR